MKRDLVQRVDLYGDNIGFVELVDYMGNDLTIVNAARVSLGVHKNEVDERDKRLIDYLVEHKHTSTFEHNTITFRVSVPLFVRSQHMRHRTWSYNEISRRYTDIDIQFYSPTMFRTQHKSNRQASNADDLSDPMVDCGALYDKAQASYLVDMHHKKSLKLFEKLTEAGVCREQARGVLPQNMYTKYYATCNLNNLLKFISLRVHEGAQLEIQELAHGMLKIAKVLWPIAIESYDANKK